MSRISEVYLSTVASFMEPTGIERGFMLLMYINDHNGLVTQKDLSVALKRDKVAILRATDYLSSLDLIERKQDKDDRRCQKLALTNKGIEIMPFLKNAIEKTNKLLFEDFSDEELEFFRSGMDKLYKKIGTLPEPQYIVVANKRNKKQKET